jgi:membrane fusion protein, copper/silver efflux system
MTSSTRFTRLRSPLVVALLTALTIALAMWVQRWRGAWPFMPASQTATITTASPGAAAPHEQQTPTAPHDFTVDVSAPTVRELDIRVERVRRESLTQTVRAVATVVPDESRISHVHTRVPGWVEELYVNTTGEIVRSGQPLARIFSQELLSSQTEYLAVRKTTAAAGIASAVVASGRTRLTVLGMTPAEIDAIERSGEPMRLVTVFAPHSGVVVNRGVTVGTSVDPSTTLLTVADLSRVWILAEVPEASIPLVRAGMTAQLDFPASGRPPFAARVAFAYPTLTERTRTLRVRFSAANAQGALRPGLYGTAAFETTGPPAIAVPRDAVVDTGLQQHVFVATNGRFEPRPVAVGMQLTDRVEIRSGLAEGEQIVVAGVFLLDSESRLRATGGAGGHAHGTAPAADAGKRQAPKTTAAPASHDRPPVAPPPPARDPHAGHKE